MTDTRTGASGAPQQGSQGQSAMSGAQRSGPDSSLSPVVLHPGPEDTLVTREGAVTHATVPIHHLDAGIAAGHASPDALRHEQTRGVLGQENEVHFVHFYSVEAITAAGAPASKPVPEKKKGLSVLSSSHPATHEASADSATTAAKVASGGVSGPDSEVVQDPCHLSTGQ